MEKGKVWVEVPYSKSEPFFARLPVGRPKRVFITVSGDESVAFMKLKITEATGIEPGQQILTYRDAELVDETSIRDSLLVQEYGLYSIYFCTNITGRAIVFLNYPAKVDQKISPAPVTPVLVQKPRTSKKNGKGEEGFKGSRLTSSREALPSDEQEVEQPWSCTACTMDNSPFVTTCSVCGSPAPQSNGNWVCTTCTVINEQEHSECDTCGSKKP